MVVADLAFASPTVVLASASALPLISVIYFYALALSKLISALIFLADLIFSLVKAFYLMT